VLDFCHVKRVKEQYFWKRAFRTTSRTGSGGMNLRQHGPRFIVWLLEG
jgi:hypothetical protein